ncbi:MAG: hypothetical protein AAGA56_19155, partial [Myxococcota bacterium]
MEVFEKRWLVGDEFDDVDDDPRFVATFSFADPRFGLATTLAQVDETISLYWEVTQGYLLAREADGRNGPVRLSFAASSLETACSEPA